MIVHYAISSLIPPVQAQALEVALHKILETLGCEIKAGTSPPSLAEIMLQKDIDTLKATMGKK